MSTAKRPKVLPPRGVYNSAQVDEAFRKEFPGRPLPGSTSLSDVVNAYNVAGGLSVKYGRSIKRITLERWLVSLIAYYPDHTSFLDLLVLFDNILHLQELASKDPHFNDKFGRPLEVLASLLKEMRINNGLTQNQLKRLSNRFLEDLGSFLIPARHFEHVRQHIQGKVQFLVNKSLGTPNASIRPTAYIGIGYRDKGTARKPWLDGSPSWQEVASAPLWQVKQIGV